MNPKNPENKKSVPAPLVFFSLLCFALLMYVSIHETPTRTYSVFKRTWGFDQFLFYEPITRYVILVVCLFLLVPFSNNLLRLPIARFTELLHQVRKKKWLVFSILSLTSVILFYLFQVKYHFLGDFNLRLIQTMKKEWVNTEYATMRLLYGFASAGKLVGANPEQMFRLYSCLLGGVYVFFSFLIADVLGTNLFRKLIIFLAQVSTALILVFCGYVEIYATPALLLHIYTYCGIRYLQGKQTIAWPVVAFIAAVASHLLCAAALPSLLVLVYFRNKEKFPFIRDRKNWVLGLVITLGVVLAAILALRSGHVFVLPWEHNTYMTFLSKPHVWEGFNGQFLASGLFFVFLFVFVLWSIVKHIRWSGSEYFLLAISGGLFFLVCMSNLQRGSGDWDLMSFPALGLNILVALLVFRVSGHNQNTAFYLATLITGITALNSFLWVHIHSSDRSISKIKTMLMNDPGTYYVARISGAVQLALAYKNNNLLRQSEEISLETCRNAQREDVRACVMYAVRLKESGRIEEARVFFEDLLHNRTPNVIEAYLFLLKYYQDTKNNKQIHYYLDKLYNSFKAEPSPFINNANFKKSSFVNIFEVYYTFEEPKHNEAHLSEIRGMIEAIKELKQGPVK